MRTSSNSARRYMINARLAGFLECAAHATSTDSRRGFECLFHLFDGLGCQPVAMLVFFIPVKVCYNMWAVQDIPLLWVIPNCSSGMLTFRLWQTFDGTFQYTCKEEQLFFTDKKPNHTLLSNALRCRGSTSNPKFSCLQVGFLFKIVKRYVRFFLLPNTERTGQPKHSKVLTAASHKHTFRRSQFSQCLGSNDWKTVKQLHMSGTVSMLIGI